MNQLTNSVQTAFNFEDYKTENKLLLSEGQKVTFKPKIILSNRDYGMLKFLIEMKFSSLDQIFLKFFKSVKPQGVETNTSYAIKRLSQLEQDGFLKSTRAFDAKIKLFYPTKKAYNTLCEVFPAQEIIKPSGSIDGRTVAHDYFVIQERLKLENEEKIRDWISDRKLSVFTGIHSSLGKGNTPDGIYTNLENQKVAFELEVSVKAKAKYEEKVKRYVSIIRENANDPDSFKTVHFVVYADATLKHLTNYTSIYKQYFKIQKVNSNVHIHREL